MLDRAAASDSDPWRWRGDAMMAWWILLDGWNEKDADDATTDKSRSAAPPVLWWARCDDNIADEDCADGYKWNIISLLPTLLVWQWKWFLRCRADQNQNVANEIGLCPQDGNQCHQTLPISEMTINTPRIYHEGLRICGLPNQKNMMRWEDVRCKTSLSSLLPALPFWFLFSFCGPAPSHHSEKIFLPVSLIGHNAGYIFGHNLSKETASLKITPLEWDGVKWSLISNENNRCSNHVALSSLAIKLKNM